MLARPERKMQMGLLAYIRRLLGGGDAEIRLTRRPRRREKLLTPPPVVKSPRSVLPCGSAWKNLPPQRDEAKSKLGGEKKKRSRSHTPPLQEVLISTRVQKK